MTLCVCCASLCTNIEAFGGVSPSGSAVFIPTQPVGSRYCWAAGLALSTTSHLWDIPPFSLGSCWAESALRQGTAPPQHLGVIQEPQGEDTSVPSAQYFTARTAGMQPKSALNLVGWGTPVPVDFSLLCCSRPRHFPCPTARAMPCATSAVRLLRGGASGSFSVGTGVSENQQAPGKLPGHLGTTDPPCLL